MLTSQVNLERKALRDVVPPNDLVLPRGTHVAVECSMMSDASNYPDPTTYDGYRFLKLRQSGDITASLVLTSPPARCVRDRETHLSG